MGCFSSLHKRPFNFKYLLLLPVLSVTAFIFSFTGHLYLPVVLQAAFSLKNNNKNHNTKQTNQPTTKKKEDKKNGVHYCPFPPLPQMQ